LGTNFYLRDHHVGKVTRAEAVLADLSNLNQSVEVSVSKTHEIEDLSTNFNVVVVTDHYDKEYLLKLDHACRNNKVGFIYAGNLGVYGFTFVDYGDEHVVNDIFLGEFPWMTENGTFIYNGTERVVVSQLIRSPGVYFEAPTDRATGRPLAMAKLIPDRGAWMEFETRKSDYIILKFNRKRTVPITVFLRALAAVGDGMADSPLKTGSDEEIMSLFQDVDNNPDRLFIPSTLKQEPEWDLSGGKTIAEAALIEFFKKMRPGDPATLDNAKAFLEEQLFDQRHYYLTVFF